MSVVSSIIGSLHDVPASIVSGLNELRATDGRSHDIQLELAAAESAILNDLKNAIGGHFLTYSLVSFIICPLIRLFMHR